LIPSVNPFSSSRQKICPAARPGKFHVACTDGDLRHGGRSASGQAHDSGDHEQDDRHEEDDLRNFDRETRDAAESQHGSDQGDNQEGQSPTKHGNALLMFAPALTVATLGI
jgi:hypothetical protein